MRSVVVFVRAPRGSARPRGRGGAAGVALTLGLHSGPLTCADSARVAPNAARALSTAALPPSANIALGGENSARQKKRASPERHDARCATRAPSSCRTPPQRRGCWPRLQPRRRGLMGKRSTAVLSRLAAAALLWALALQFAPLSPAARQAVQLVRDGAGSGSASPPLRSKLTPLRRTLRSCRSGRCSRSASTLQPPSAGACSPFPPAPRPPRSCSGCAPLPVVGPA